MLHYDLPSATGGPAQAKGVCVRRRGGGENTDNSKAFQATTKMFRKTAQISLFLTTTVLPGHDPFWKICKSKGRHVISSHTPPPTRWGPFQAPEREEIVEL